MLTGFPTPWAVFETTGEFIVMDASGRTLAHFYWWGDGHWHFSRGTRRDAWRKNFPRRRSLSRSIAKAGRSCRHLSLDLTPRVAPTPPYLRIIPTTDPATVGMLRSLSAAAMPRCDVTPAARSPAMTDAKSTSPMRNGRADNREKDLESHFRVPDAAQPARQSREAT
jgi:hypothetical protein